MANEILQESAFITLFAFAAADRSQKIPTPSAIAITRSSAIVGRK